MKVVLPDFIDIPHDARQELKSLGAEIFDDIPNESQLIQRIKNAEVISANYIDVTPAVIDACPNLKYIIVPAVGYEWVDAQYATTKGIKVLNCPTNNSHAVAEHALTLLFATARKLPQAITSLRNGKWQPKELQGIELKSRKLGIIGYGRIGKDIADMARALSMHVQFVNTASSATAFDDVLKDSDVICACLPLTDETRHIIDARRLGLLKSDAIIINVGRGATIDQSALYEMLQSGRLTGAGLDVFQDEPLSGEPHEAIIKLANLPNVTATPHIGYNTRETTIRLGQELVANLRSCLASKPQNVVN